MNRFTRPVSYRDFGIQALPFLWSVIGILYLAPLLADAQTTIPPPPPRCGDGTCNGTETPFDCPGDCTAATTGGTATGGTATGGTATGGTATGGTAGTPCAPGSLCNPLRFSTISSFLAAILQAVILIAFPIIVLFMVYAGFKFVAAQGNPAEIAKARQIFLWTVIGALLILGAQALSYAIEATVNQLQGP